MNTDFEIRDVPTQPILFATGTCTHDQIGPIIGRLLSSVGSYIRAQGGTPAGPPFARWTRWGETDCDLEAGIALVTPVAGSEEIHSGTLGGGPAAFCLHIGPYDQLTPVYYAMAEWVKEQGRTPAGAPWDSYVNDPMDLPPSEWRTELFLPVEQTD